MVLLQRSWPCSRYRPQPTALPRAREMHSQAPGGGDMLTLCVPRCLTMAIFCPGVSQKWPRTGKGPLRGNISPPCIQNELVLARYARHVFEKPCKSPLEDTLREYLARTGPFSLHKPLESCTARRSCHDSACARPCARKARGAGYRNHGSCRSVAGGANPWQSVLRRASSAAVRMRVLSCGIRPPAACVSPTVSARLQQPSPPALLGGRAPNDSRMSSWRIPLHSRYPHFFGRRRPSLDVAQKTASVCWPFFARL